MSNASLVNSTLSQKEAYFNPSSEPNISIFDVEADVGSPVERKEIYFDSSSKCIGILLCDREIDAYAYDINCLYQLPSDILSIILDNLDCESIIRFLWTCKRFNELPIKAEWLQAQFLYIRSLGSDNCANFYFSDGLFNSIYAMSTICLFLKQLEASMVRSVNITFSEYGSNLTSERDNGKGINRLLEWVDKESELSLNVLKVQGRFGSGYRDGFPSLKKLNSLSLSYKDACMKLHEFDALIYLHLGRLFNNLEINSTSMPNLQELIIDEMSTSFLNVANLHELRTLKIFLIRKCYIINDTTGVRFGPGLSELKKIELGINNKLFEMYADGSYCNTVCGYFNAILPRLEELSIGGSILIQGIEEVEKFPVLTKFAFQELPQRTSFLNLGNKVKERRKERCSLESERCLFLLSLMKR